MNLVCMQSAPFTRLDVIEIYIYKLSSQNFCTKHEYYFLIKDLCRVNELLNTRVTILRRIGTVK